MEEGVVAVIFDMDGVLVDSYWAHLESWRVVAREEVAEVTEEQFAATFGRRSCEIIGLLWPDRRDDPAAVRELDERKEEAFRQIIVRDFPFMPGARRLLEALCASGIRMAIGSSGPPPNVALVLEKLGAARWFAAQVTGEDVSRGKPDPQVFLLAAARLGAPPEQCVVVEDAALGIAAARAAGMACVGLASTGRSRAELAAADLVVDSLDALDPEVFRALARRARRGGAGLE